MIITYQDGGTASFGVIKLLTNNDFNELCIVYYNKHTYEGTFYDYYVSEHAIKEARIIKGRRLIDLDDYS